MNISPQKQTERWLTHAFPDSSSAHHPAAPTPSTLLFIVALFRSDYTLYLKKKIRVRHLWASAACIYKCVSIYVKKRKKGEADPIVPMFKTVLWVPIDHRITSRSFFSPNRPTSPAFTYLYYPLFTHSLQFHSSSLQFSLLGPFVLLCHRGFVHVFLSVCSSILSSYTLSPPLFWALPSPHLCFLHPLPPSPKF